MLTRMTLPHRLNQLQQFASAEVTLERRNRTGAASAPDRAAVQGLVHSVYNKVEVERFAHDLENLSIRAGELFNVMRTDGRQHEDPIVHHLEIAEMFE